MKHVPRPGITLALVAVTALQACVQRPKEQNENGLPTQVAAASAQAPARDAAAPTKYALLVGCTKYDHLDRAYHLEGPANDVLLMRDVLKDLYKFQDADIVILSEAAGKERGAKYRPTRENIQREFAELAKKAQKGDKVMILLGGHGSQQPDSRPDDPERFEPDGKEEIFLPADCGQWDGISSVKNAIVDYEFADWLKAIRKKQASLSVIVDACHSASMIRGTEVPREVPADKLVPKEVLQKAEDKARKRQTENKRGPAKKEAPFKLPPEEPDLVVIYAAQSTEPTVELLLPEEGASRKSQGLLTYTLCKMLVEAHEAKSPLTYHELLQRIHDQYRAWGRAYPTPQIEGKDRNRVVLGEEVRGTRDARALFALNRDAEEHWIIQAGALHGLMAGSILRVYPPAGKPNADKPMGHVRIAQEGFGTLRARVDPCAYAGMPEPKELLKDSRCEVVLMDFGDQRLTLAVDQRTDKGELVPEQKRRTVQDLVTKLAEGEESLVTNASSVAAARWLLRFDSLDSEKLYVVPASGWYLSGQPGAILEGGALGRLPPLFGPVPSGARRLKWLRDAFASIARVRNLLGIVNLTRNSPLGFGEAARAIKVRLELVRLRGEADLEGVPLERGTQGLALYDGDSIGVKIINDSRGPVDVTLLMVDSRYAVKSLFPEKAGIDNRIQPGKDLALRITATADTTGLEHLVLIAVNAKDLRENAYFGFLEQTRLDSASRAVLATSEEARERGFNSPFGRLLRKAVYGDGTVKERTVQPAKLAEYSLQMLSYNMLPAKRPAKKK